MSSRLATSNALAPAQALPSRIRRSPACLDQPTVDGIERHHVGYRAKRNEVEAGHSGRAACQR